MKTFEDFLPLVNSPTADCVHVAQCPGTATPAPTPATTPAPVQCRADEVLKACGTPCQDYCGKPQGGTCATYCVENQCECASGSKRLVNSPTAECVHVAQCPGTATTQVATVPQGCAELDYTCTHSADCSWTNAQTCEAKTGMAPTPAPTPAPVQCRADEVVKACGTPCQDYCGKPQGGMCATYCVENQCECASGSKRLVNSPTADCVHVAQCPGTASTPAPTPATTPAPVQCRADEVLKAC
eukprot:gene57943-biopygen36822